MHKKKILFFITKSNWGGAQRYVFDLATHLDKSKYDVSVALGGHGPLGDKLRAEGIEIIHIPYLERNISPLKELKVVAQFARVIRRKKPDIVHLNSSKAAGIGAIVGRILRVPKIIFTLHGLALNERRPGWQKFIIKWIYAVIAVLSHHTIAVSEALATQLRKEVPFISKRIITIHNGIAHYETLTKTDARALLGKHLGKELDLQIASFVIGTIGELHPIKGHQFLLEGFKEATYQSALPIYLFIVGDGEEKEKIAELIKEMKLERRVFMCGHIDDAGKVMKGFDIFILPSISEGLPYVVIESGHAAIPTIASRTGGIPEIITDHESGLLITPRSAEEITKSIIEIIYNPELRKQLGSNLHKKVSSEFSLDQMLEKTLKLYE